MGQLLQLIPRHVFDHLVDSHAWQGPNPRKFTYWSHLVAMLFGQWSARKSLRDVVFSVNRQAHKLYHLGLSRLKRSTLADANQQRPAIIFEKTYYKLYERLSAELAPQPQKAPQIKIIDATTIDLCAAVFPWAKFRTRKGGPSSCIPSSAACCPSVSWSRTVRPMTSRPCKACALSRAIC
jgi:hypothetical protein